MDTQEDVAALGADASAAFGVLNSPPPPKEPVVFPVGFDDPPNSGVEPEVAVVFAPVVPPPNTPAPVLLPPNKPPLVAGGAELVVLLFPNRFPPDDGVPVFPPPNSPPPAVVDVPNIFPEGVELAAIHDIRKNDNIASISSYTHIP